MIIKLEPGQKLLFTIASAEEVQGNYGPQIKFSNTDGDTLFLNVDTAVKQLGRIGIPLDGAVGQTVEIERVEKNGTKYTNINKPSTAKLAAAAPKHGYSLGGPLPGEAAYQEPVSQIHPATATIGDRLTAMFQLYDVCMDQAIVAARKLDTAKIGSSPEAVAAMCATLFIAAKDRYAA